jgi:shikimate kinase
MLEKYVPQKQFRNIIVIGLPASGKTTFAKAYSVCTKRQFLDLDRYIEFVTHKTIAQLFESKALQDDEGMTSEQKFRQIEKKALEKILRRSNTVMSLGGGTVQSEEVFKQIQSMGLVVSLNASQDTLAKRIFSQQGTRPLFSDCTNFKEIKKKLESLSENRLPFVDRADVCLNSEFSSVDNLSLELKWNEKELFRREWVRDMLLCVDKEYLTSINPFERFKKRAKSQHD